MNVTVWYICVEIGIILSVILIQQIIIATRVELNKSLVSKKFYCGNVLTAGLHGDVAAVSMQ